MNVPRSADSAELPALCQFIDNVFFDGACDEMRSRFPYFLHEDNRSNLLVIHDGEKFVAHAGMTQRWATLAGATVRVACLGAVATNAKHRGKGLAGRLLTECINKAAADGVDFMLISGDRPLYRRAGAAAIGRYTKATLAKGAAVSGNIELRPGTEHDLPACAALYRQKPVRFMREPRDWQAYAESRYAMWNRSRLWIVERTGRAAAYLVVAEPRDSGTARVAEFAGDETALAIACPAVLERTEADTLAAYIEAQDSVLLDGFRNSGAETEPCQASGTLLIVNPSQIAERIRPLIAEHAGAAAASSFSISNEGNMFRMTCEQAVLEAENLPALAEQLFGLPVDTPQLPGIFNQFLPLPALWYGLNFV